MADFISRDYAVENMENFPWDTEHDKNAAIHLVRELVPAADVRPVVHEPDDRERICLWALDHFGVEHQKRKLMEELAELMTEIAREQDGRTDRERIREELADVIIMCRQMRIVYGAAKVDGWIERKLQRLVDRMNEEGPDGCE